MKLYISLFILFWIGFFAEANINSDLSYENKLHQIYMKHYKNPVPHDKWTLSVSRLNKNYTLKHKDTLWDLSSEFFEDNFYWSKLWVANPSIENPHRIYKGDSIKFDVATLAAVNSSPYSTSMSSQLPNVNVPPQKHKRTALSEREFPSSLPVIKNNFIQRSESDIELVIGPDPIRKEAPLPVYLSENPINEVGRVMGKEGYGLTALNGENVIVNIDSAIDIGGKYTVVEAKRSINSSLFNLFQGKGHEVLIKGEIKILSHISEADSLYLAQVTKSMDLISKGDAIIAGKIPVYTLSQKGSFGSSQGSIIAAFQSQSEIFSLYSVVYLDKGRSHGVQTGDLYYIRGNPSYMSDRAFSYKQPYIGQLRVIHTNPESSTALIIESKERIYRGDIFTGSLKLISDSSELKHHEEIEVEEIDDEVPSEEDQNSKDSEEELEDYLDREGLESVPEEASSEEDGDHENIEENIQDVEKEFEDFEKLEDVEDFEVIDDADSQIEKEYFEEEDDEEDEEEEEGSADQELEDEF